MKHFLFLIVAAVVCLPAMGQNITLSTGADLYERPESTSNVKMQLPAGIELGILSEQGEWLAVSTSTGIVGWIRKPAENEAPNGDLDDLLRSIDEAGAETPTPAPPTPASQAAPATPPPPAPAPAPPAPAISPAAGATQPAANVAPPPPATPSATPPPPPPSARPPSMGDGVSFGNAPPPDAPFTNVAAGFYDKYQWVTAALDLKEEYKRLDLQFNKLLGNITQLGAWLSGIDGFPIVDLSQEDEFGSLFKGETAQSCPCGDEVTTVQGGLRLNFYPVVPTADRPFGAYVGGFLGGGTFFGDDAPEEVSVATAGGELGIYSKFGSPNSPQFIPSAAIQLSRTEFICSGDSEFCGFNPDTFDSKDTIGDTGTTIRLGLEMNYHGLVPGVHLTLVESPDPEKSFETLFGFGFTLAY